ncbi:hypothetical protein BGZ50_009494 [Haplosporangium sp. Z 11]|nr:hypothetical protein BGZ50_009494 [Haplosporangium sp. Z 11]
MHSRARNQVYWDKYWHQLETRQGRGLVHKSKRVVKDTFLGDDPGYDSGFVPYCEKSVFLTRSNNSIGDSSVFNETESNHSEALKQETADANTATTPVDNEELEYSFFPQLLNHYSSYSTAQQSSPNNTFRQYYHIQSEFYKPGGPIILWLSGESPLHTIFLQRGLAYELANATSGLLVALEHRFYGNSIPRFQDSSSQKNNELKNQHEAQLEFNARTRQDRNSWSASPVSPTHRIKNGPSFAKSTRDKEPLGAADKISHEDEKEGLPLDLLKYLTVDQSIEDVAYFIGQFPALQPTFFADDGAHPDTSTGSPTTTRWILAGCSYGGNLAAWTRQRYPSKIFAAFASSAPVRSVLDFFEYSASQSDVLGNKCSRRLALARDFLDDALQMTDRFMQLIDNLDWSKAESSKIQQPAATDNNADLLSQVHSPSPSSPSSSSSKRYGWSQEMRQAAKLKVLTWFSPDFAQEYAVEGEEVRAAGWIWWTVASAVQYNTVITPPTVQPSKTTIDILCDTMALGGDHDDDDGDDGIETPAGVRGLTASAVRYAQALATWFKDQQYFTPIKAEDLRPSDLDQNSVQNLASMAWSQQHRTPEFTPKERDAPTLAT